MTDKGKNPPFIEPTRVITRGELQATLRKRIEAGDKEAERLWAEWRRVDRMMDRFRDKPLYPPQDDGQKK